MERYIIQNEFMEKNNGRENIDVIYKEIEPTHVYRNSYYYGDNITYEEDKCLNRFDLNESIIDKIIETSIYSKLWVINPAFINLNLAIKLANIGKGKYLPNDFKRIYEINVLRYLAGEKEESLNCIIKENFNDKSIVSLKDEYTKRLLNEYKELIKEKEYLEEEKRALLEEDQRLNGKMNYCLDIMKDITVAKTRLLQLKNKK